RRVVAHADPALGVTVPGPVVMSTVVMGPVVVGPVIVVLAVGGHQQGSSRSLPPRYASGPPAIRGAGRSRVPLPRRPPACDHSGRDPGARASPRPSRRRIPRAPCLRRRLRCPAAAPHPSPVWGDEREAVSLALEWAASHTTVATDPKTTARSAADLQAEVGETITEGGIGAVRAMELFDEVLLPATRSSEDPMNLAYIPAAPTRA